MDKYIPNMAHSIEQNPTRFIKKSISQSQSRLRAILKNTRRNPFGNHSRYSEAKAESRYHSHSITSGTYIGNNLKTLQSVQVNPRQIYNSKQSFSEIKSASSVFDINRRSKSELGVESTYSKYKQPTQPI